MFAEPRYRPLSRMRSSRSRKSSSSVGASLWMRTVSSASYSVPIQLDEWRTAKTSTCDGFIVCDGVKSSSACGDSADRALLARFSNRLAPFAYGNDGCLQIIFADYEGNFSSIPFWCKMPAVLRGCCCHERTRSYVRSLPEMHTVVDNTAPLKPKRNKRRSPRAKINMHVKVWRRVNGEKKLVPGYSRNIRQDGIAVFIPAH